MKIAPKQIESYVAKPDASHRAVLLYGPDAGLVRERAKKLTAVYLGVNFDPFALVELSESAMSADPARLADELSSISMMAPKRVILIRDAGEKAGRAIESAVSFFNKDVLLIVCADELQSRSGLRGWFEKEFNAAAIACYRDEVRDVQEVIRNFFDKAAIRADRDAVEYLAQQLGNDRYVTYQELEKLTLYAGDGKKIEPKDAVALVDYNRETSFDDMVNAVADRNLPQLEKTLGLLLREGTQPVAYLRALQRYFNRLYFIRAQMQQNGQSAEQIVATLRPSVFFRQVPILIRHINQWTTPNIVRALALLVRAELACKTSDLPILSVSGRNLLQITQIR